MSVTIVGARHVKDTARALLVGVKHEQFWLPLTAVESVPLSWRSHFENPDTVMYAGDALVVSDSIAASKGFTPSGDLDVHASLRIEVDRLRGENKKLRQELDEARAQSVSARRAQSSTDRQLRALQDQVQEQRQAASRRERRIADRNTTTADSVATTIAAASAAPPGTVLRAPALGPRPAPTPTGEQHWRPVPVPQRPERPTPPERPDNGGRFNLLEID